MDASSTTLSIRMDMVSYFIAVMVVLRQDSVRVQAVVGCGIGLFDSALVSGWSFRGRISPSIEEAHRNGRIEGYGTGTQTLSGSTR